MNNVIDQLVDISTKLEKSGADVTELENLSEGFYEYEKTEQGYRCQLKERGICMHLMGEDADCYYNFDGCFIKKAGLYRCGEIGEVVDQEECQDCNAEVDCGCCEYVQNGDAPFNCGACARIKIEIEDIGFYCVPADTSPEEIERIKQEAKENPGEYFTC